MQPPTATTASPNSAFSADRVDERTAADGRHHLRDELPRPRPAVGRHRRRPASHVGVAMLVAAAACLEYQQKENTSTSKAGAPRMFDNLPRRILAKRDPIDPLHYQPLKATLAMFREGKQNVQLG